MVSVCLPSDALLQHLPSYLGFSYLGHRVSLHGCSSKAQLLLLTLDEGYLLTTALPDLQLGMAPLGPPASTTPWTWVCSSQPPPDRHPGPQSLGSFSRLPALASVGGVSSQLLPLTSGSGWLLRVTAPGLGLGVAPQGHRHWPRMWGVSSRR